MIVSGVYIVGRTFQDNGALVFGFWPRGEYSANIILNQMRDSSNPTTRPRTVPEILTWKR